VHYCVDDYQRLYGTRCYVCCEFVEGEVITALGNTYHSDCFHCSRCRYLQIPLTLGLRSVKSKKFLILPAPRGQLGTADFLFCNLRDYGYGANSSCGVPVYWGCRALYFLWDSDSGPSGVRKFGTPTPIPDLKNLDTDSKSDFDFCTRTYCVTYCWYA